MVTSLAYKANFREKKITRDKEGQYIIIKYGYTRKTYNTNVSITNNKASTYMKQNSIEGKEEINIPLQLCDLISPSHQVIGKTTSQKISKDTEDPNNKIN